jgi:hypothetical protein
LRNFINKTILGITGMPQLEGSEDLFQMMKNTGFLTTTIPTTLHYLYSQKIAAREVFQNHSEVDTLILGCGSFIPANISYGLFKKQDGGCGACECLHCLQKQEITVSLMDPTQNHFDIREGYNEEGSGSDIIGDIHSNKLWEGIREGLGDRKLKAIKDHSWGVFNTREDLTNAFSVLKDEGRLELETSQAAMDELIALGLDIGFRHFEIIDTPSKKIIFIK